MKQLILLHTAIFLAFAALAQKEDNFSSPAKVIYKTSTLSNGRIYTEAYAPNSILIKAQSTPCNFCYIDADFALPSTIADTLKKRLPLKASEMADKNIDLVLTIQPNLKGAVIEAHCGWIYSKEIKLFSESELALIRSTLLKLSFKVTSIDRNNNSQLCQPLTMILDNRYWKK